MAKRLLMVCDLAEFLGCLTYLLCKLTRLRKIPYVKWRGCFQFYVSLRDRFIEENIKQPVDWVKKSEVERSINEMV